MGGFRFNGCGVTDHFKTIKSLGVHVCPSCKKLTEFSLDEANQKVDVFFIPTFTIKSRYAVMCKKCKNGEFCSTEWAGYLMNQTASQEILFESEAKNKGWSSATRSFQDVSSSQGVTPVALDTAHQGGETGQGGAERMKPVFHAGMSVGSKLDFFKCPHCGITQMREGDCCSYCGKPAPAASGSRSMPGQQFMQGSQSVAGQQDTSEQRVASGRQTASADDQRTCPSCGCMQEAGNKFCIRCGQKMALDQPKEKFCPHCGVEATEGMLFCRECGTRLV